MNNITLTNRAELVMTGITKVKSTEPHLVTAAVAEGGVLIAGANLSVQHLDVKEGNLIIAGRIDSIKYTNQVSKSFSLRNMFK